MNRGTPPPRPVGQAGKDSDRGAPAPRVVPSRQLLGDQRQVHIEHLGEHYILRLTSRGKLILTK